MRLLSCSRASMPARGGMPVAGQGEGWGVVAGGRVITVRVGDTDIWAGAVVVAETEPTVGRVAPAGPEAEAP